MSVRIHALPASPLPETNRLTQIAELWNLAFPPEYALSLEHLLYRLAPAAGLGHAAGAGDSGLQTSAALALAGESGSDEGLPVGCVLVSCYQDQGRSRAHIDGIAVHPEHQRQGAGAMLLAWAQQWAVARGAAIPVVGSGPMRLLPGAPDDLPMAGQFFRNRGLQTGPVESTDWVTDVAGYTPPGRVVEIAGAARPLAPTERGYLDACRAQMPAPDRVSIHAFLARGGRVSDLMGLWTAGGLAAVAQITVEDSAGGIAPWFPYDLPKPWAAARLLPTPGMGAAWQWGLLDAVLRRLHNTGVNSCVLYATEVLDDPAGLADFGFRPYRRFRAYKQDLPGPDQ